MYGAILGDIIGSPFEFMKDHKTKDFPLFSNKSHFTDDTVMTIAICNGLCAEELDEKDSEVIKKSLVKSVQMWGQHYPHVQYGRRFKLYLYDKDAEPLNSFGNGSAMRVSSVGWLYDSLERTREIAKLTAIISHNHIEGIKGAESVASAIYLARNGSSKKEIKEYIEKEFNYNLSRSLDEIRINYHHIESCQESVPESIIAFLEGKDFIDSIRNAVSLGGDSDTQSCIAGSIAEAYWGISYELKEECRKRVTSSVIRVLDYFDTVKKERRERK